MLSRFLSALVPLGTNLIELFIVPAIALEASDVVEAPPGGHAGCQSLNVQAKGGDAIIAQEAWLAFLMLLGCLSLLVLTLLYIVMRNEQ